jgi:hypothetical protein
MAQVILHPREGRSARDYALLYIGLGWKVFPIWGIRDSDGVRSCACDLGLACDRPGKHPMAHYVPGGLNDASNERGDIERWWGARPDASIGIATGQGSGLTVVDADATGGKPGVVNLTALCARNGGVPATFAVNTGGGGIHLYFRYSSALQTGTNVLGEAIDVRNDGGYVIAPPSLHMLGVYKWRSDTAELLDLPAWMRPSTGQVTRGRGRPRTRVGLRIEKAELMLRHVDQEDRDTWLKIGVILGRVYVGTPAEAEAWALYESWSARSQKFDEHRSENLARMREMFYEQSQAAPRAGQEPLGPGTLIEMARRGGWTPFGNRAVVNFEPGNEAIMCEALIQALTQDRSRNRFFNVSGEVRDIVRSPIPQTRLMVWAAERGEPLPETLHVRRTQAASLQCALSEVAALAISARNGEPQSKSIPQDLANMMLKDRARDFPSLAGIAEWPMVTVGSGQLIMGERGYDETTGLYFDIDPKVKIERVAPEVAWNWLNGELLRDFPFENDLQRAAALALLLAFMQRPMMKTCPAFAVVAPQPGTGKTTLLEVASLAIHGAPIIPHAFSHEDEELRKALQALMMAKVPAVLFDNIGRGKAISSDHLSKLITSETAADRVLGSSDMRKEVNSMLIAFTGNNISFVRDMASRVVVIRLNARTVNPLRRNFAKPDIRLWCMEHRSQILSALVSIAALADGQRPTGNASRFEDYDTVLVRPVQRLLGVDVRELFTVVDADVEEDELARDALTVLWNWQQQWRGAENAKEWRVRDVVEAINGNGMPEQARGSIKQFCGTMLWEKDALRALGYALRGVKDDYMYHPYRIESRATKEAARWIVRHADEAAATPNGSGPDQHPEAM